MCCLNEAKGRVYQAYMGDFSHQAEAHLGRFGAEHDF